MTTTTQPIAFQVSSIDRLDAFLRKLWPEIEHTKNINGDCITHVWDCDRADEGSRRGHVLITENEAPNGYAQGEFAGVIRSALKPSQVCTPSTAAARPSGR